ncbi:rhodanese-like domain-containing protein [Erythrobacter sp. R86502]|uniref:rhodanese-like domain-containing protein n=1 Tax=Erythrobacter sp. R86502 TaxID=3093846 RepID=UPI0036D3C027
MKAPPFLAAPAVLFASALTACGGEGGGEDGSPAPLGFELAFAGVSSGDSAAEAAEPGPQAALIALSPDELADRIALGHVRLIDLRTDAEIAEGIITGAEHIPLDQFDPASLDLSDGREVVLYCRSGRRSTIAGERLAQVTGAPAVHLGGGIIAWQAANRPIETP